MLKPSDVGVENEWIEREEKWWFNESDEIRVMRRGGVQDKQ